MATMSDGKILKIAAGLLELAIMDYTHQSRKKSAFVQSAAKSEAIFDFWLRTLATGADHERSPRRDRPNWSWAPRVLFLQKKYRH
jgi:hypothetical protein